MRRFAVAAGVGVVVLAVLFPGCDGGGEERTGSPCPNKTTASLGESGGYGGVLFDAHVRLAEPGMAAALVCAMAPNEVEAFALVAPMDPDDTFVTESAYREAVAGHEAAFVPFFDVNPATPADMAPERLERVLIEVGLFFRGVWAPDLALVPGETFDFAAQRDLFVTVRSAGGGGATLERALAVHPDTKVLVVGAAAAGELADLLARHERLFVVLEAGSLEATGDWLAVVQAGPDRVMWGSGADAADDVAPEAYGGLVASTRRFIDRLPQPMRKPFAVGNARRLLGIPEPLQPDA